MAGAGKRGVIAIAVVAKTDKFKKGLKDAEKRVGRFGKSVRAMGRVVAAGAAAIVAMGVAAFAWARKSAKATDATAKFAKRLGLAVEELSALEFHGKRAGLAVNQVRLGIQRMGRRVSEAAKGTGEAQAALKELRLDAVKLSQLPLEQQLAAIADALHAVKNPADKVRLAFKLFDSEGVGMLNMLRGGAKAMKEMRIEAETFGAVITKDAAAAAERFEDSMTNIGASAGKLGRELVIVAEGPLTKFMNQLGAALAQKRRLEGFFGRGRAARQARPWQERYSDADLSPQDRRYLETQDAISANFLSRLANARLPHPAMPQLEQRGFEHPKKRQFEIAEDQFGPAYGARTAGIVTTHISDAITTGLFEGFSGDAGQQILESFGRSITQTVMDALLEAVIATPIKKAAESLFSSLATSAVSTI